MEPTPACGCTKKNRRGYWEAMPVAHFPKEAKGRPVRRRAARRRALSPELASRFENAGTSTPSGDRYSGDRAQSRSKARRTGSRRRDVLGIAAGGDDHGRSRDDIGEPGLRLPYFRLTRIRAVAVDDRFAESVTVTVTV